MEAVEPGRYGLVLHLAGHVAEHEVLAAQLQELLAYQLEPLLGAVEFSADLTSDTSPE